MYMYIHYTRMQGNQGAVRELCCLNENFDLCFVISAALAASGRVQSVYRYKRSEEASGC